MPRDTKTKKKRPDTPEHLEGEAVLEWCRLADELEAEGRLELSDRAVLTLAAETYAIYQHCRRQVHAAPLVMFHNGVPGRHPLGSMMKEQATLYRQLLTDLRLTPATRPPIDDGSGFEDLDI